MGTNALEKIAENNGLYFRPLVDLPPEQEINFRPNSFVSRKFLERIRKLVKDEIKPYILTPPPDVAGYESDGYYRRAVSWPMVMERRRQQQRARLKQKRSNYDVIERKPLYVWVFWCPGIGGFAYRGWWLYIVGRGIDSGKYLERDTRTVLRLMELFPLGTPDIEKWKMEFVKRYQRGCWCGKPQGKALIWAEVKGSYIKNILCRA